MLTYLIKCFLVIWNFGRNIAQTVVNGLFDVPRPQAATNLVIN